jgi:hypothetical protein
MNTQVIFKIDKKIKEKVAKKAKSKGMAVSDVLKMAMYGYAEGAFEPSLFPNVNRAEQRDIETRYGKKPSRKAVGTISFTV